MLVSLTILFGAMSIIVSAILVYSACLVSAHTQMERSEIDFQTAIAKRGRITRTLTFNNVEEKGLFRISCG